MFMHPGGDYYCKLGYLSFASFQAVRDWKLIICSVCHLEVKRKQAGSFPFIIHLYIYFLALCHVF
jgi:hypothetical protein